MGKHRQKNRQFHMSSGVAIIPTSLKRYKKNEARIFFFFSFYNFLHLNIKELNMPAFTIAIPETPSPNYVLVKNISLASSEKTGKKYIQSDISVKYINSPKNISFFLIYIVKEFFLFCGKIKEFELIK